MKTVSNNKSEVEESSLLLRACSITRGEGRLPALCGLNTNGWVAREVVVAVTWVSPSTNTSDDDVGAKGVAGTVDGVGGSADKLISCLVT